MNKKTFYDFSIKKSFLANILTEPRVSLNSIELLALFRRLGWRILSACTSKKVKFSSRLKQLNSFAYHLLRMTRHHGAGYTVGYLKASQLAVQKRIGKNGVKSLREINDSYPFPRLTSSGLPTVIPLGDRRAILSGNEFVIRWWLTLFALYRIVKIPGKLKLSTITDPYSGSQVALERVSVGMSLLVRSYREMFPKGLKSTTGFQFFETASPIHSVSWHGWIIVPTLLQELGMTPYIKILSEKVNSRLWLQYTFWIEAMRELGFGTAPSMWQLGSTKKSKFEGNIGQLAIKEEAAGKVRVFALVDPWTQNVLKNLHKFLFDFLKGLPNDGTFDQHASVLRGMEKVKRTGQSFGYDLSAATDRLPIDLQVSVLSALFGDDYAAAWKKLLVGRDYILHDEKYGKAKVRYAVGQPMGALSSWAMLAVTHHLLVQYSYWISRGWNRSVINGRFMINTGIPGFEGTLIGGEKVDKEKWYTGYELLGDDIVIFDKDVAEAYLNTMRELGVEINLAKSVVAKNHTVEFAKVTSHNGRNVSAISWKMFISQNTMMGRVNIAYSLLRKGIIDKSVMRWFRLLVKQGKFRQGAYNYSLVALFSMFANQGLVKLEDVLKSLYDEKHPFRKFYKSWLFNLKTPYIERLVSDLVRGSDLALAKSQLREDIWRVEQVWVRLALWRPIQNFYSKWVSTDLSGSLAKEITKRLLTPFGDLEHIGPLISEDHMGLVPKEGWDKLDYLKRAIYITIYMEINQHLDSLMSGFAKWDKRAMDDLPFLVQCTKDVERAQEFLDLVRRGDQKCDPNLEPVKPVYGDEVKEPPLKVLSLLLQ